MKQKRRYLILLLLSLISMGNNAAAQKTIAYLIPGQGADYMLFNNLHLTEQFEIRHIAYEIPTKHCSLQAYARQLSSQIDTSRKFILIGCSLGGMLATEMADFMHPEQVIVISSAKCRAELPNRYSMQTKFPLYKLVGGHLAKWSALLLQPIVEPDRNKEKATFVSMLNAKDPVFMRRSIEMIINWDRAVYDEKIIHIHGDNDHTIPVKNVKFDYLIKDGSHVMALTRGAELSVLINTLLTPQLPNS